MKSKLLTLASLASLFAALLFVLPSSVHIVHGQNAPSNFQRGDVFAGVGLGKVKHFDPNGNLLETLDTTSGSNETTGMCLDKSGSLYVTSFGAQVVSKFDKTGALVVPNFGGGYNADPESCIVDSGQNIYVGQADGLHQILKFDSTGTLLDSYSPGTDGRGTDWIDLAPDQCTMFYTSEGSTIKRFNVCTNTQLADFATGLSGPCFAHRIRPNGEVMVACSSQVYRLDASGATLKTYSTADYGESSFFFALNLDPDGASFWTAGYDTGNIYRIDIETGALIKSFDGSPLTTLAGLAVFREITSAISLKKISADPYSNNTSFHKTEVEPDTFSFGSSIVTAFQVGRFKNGGSSNIGWATSKDGGSTWKKGFLNGLTKYANGIYDRVSDPSVAYDALHDVWLISSLAIKEVPITGPTGVAVVVNRSTDGGITWGSPFVVATGEELDKNWTVCDNSVNSPHYGNCYTEWMKGEDTARIFMTTSRDGGSTWEKRKKTADNAKGNGGQPIVQPDGTVVVPYYGIDKSIKAFKSSDGGSNWSASHTIAQVNEHKVKKLRTLAFPSAEVDGAGKIYVVWQDCRFENGCPDAPNDLVMSTSTDGDTWSNVTRIPLDSVGSGVDHFIPGIGVDKSTSGESAHLGLTYYYYDNADCDVSTCHLNVGFASSADAGTTWNTPIKLSGPMKLDWLPPTREPGILFFLEKGRMVGDYISTSFVDGKVFPVFAVANEPACDKCYDEAMYSIKDGISIIANNR